MQWLDAGVHLFVRSKWTTTKVFLQAYKNMAITWGEIWNVWWMYQGFPAKYLQRIRNTSARHSVFTIHNWHSRLNFTSWYSICRQKIYYISLFLFHGLHSYIGRTRDWLTAFLARLTKKWYSGDHSRRSFLISYRGHYYKHT